MRSFVLIVLLFTVVLGKDVPTDSLLHDNGIPVTRKMAILPINFWQHISFSSGAMNCQFEPSCSQFTALAIAKHGVIFGSILGADRIIRCNPAAHQYHTQLDSGEFYQDGRLLNKVPGTIELNNSDINMIYLCLPGLSRAKSGRTIDGFYSFLMTATCGYASYHLYQNDKDIGASFFAVAGITFWLSDFYNYLHKH